MSDIQKQNPSERTYRSNSCYFYEVQNPCSSEGSQDDVTDTSTCIIIKENPEVRQIIEFEQTFGPEAEEKPKKYVNRLQLSIDICKLRKLVQELQERIEQMQSRQEKCDVIHRLSRQKANSLWRLHLSRKQLTQMTNELLGMENRQQPEELQQQIDTYKRKINKIKNQIKKQKSARETDIGLEPSAIKRLKQQLRYASLRYHKLANEHEEIHQKLKIYALRLVQTDTRLQRMVRLAKKQHIAANCNPSAIFVQEKYIRLAKSIEELKWRINITKLSFETKCNKLKQEIDHQKHSLREFEEKIKTYIDRSKSLSLNISQRVGGVNKQRTKLTAQKQIKKTNTQKANLTL